MAAGLAAKVAGETGGAAMGLDRNAGQRRASSGLPALTVSGQDGLTTHPANPSGRNLDRDLRDGTYSGLAAAVLNDRTRRMTGRLKSPLQMRDAVTFFQVTVHAHGGHTAATRMWNRGGGIGCDPK
jgi:hypothetical protein